MVGVLQGVAVCVSPQSDTSSHFHLFISAIVPCYALLRILDSHT